MHAAFHHELAAGQMVPKKPAGDVRAVHVRVPLFSRVIILLLAIPYVIILYHPNSNMMMVMMMNCRILLWAPFLNFRKFPRDPSMKYPWSVPEDPSKIKNAYLKYPFAQPEDYDVD